MRDAKVITAIMDSVDLHYNEIIEEFQRPHDENILRMIHAK